MRHAAARAAQEHPHAGLVGGGGCGLGGQGVVGGKLLLSLTLPARWRTPAFAPGLDLYVPGGVRFRCLPGESGPDPWGRRVQEVTVSSEGS
jgi:hypothetical protein